VGPIIASLRRVNGLGKRFSSDHDVLTFRRTAQPIDVEEIDGG
jgi:hypothetical protein